MSSHLFSLLVSARLNERATKSGGNGHTCLVPDLKRNTFKMSFGFGGFFPHALSQVKTFQGVWLNGKWI